MSVDVDADAAVTARIHGGCFKFRSLTSFIATKNVSLFLWGNYISDACMALYLTWKWDVVIR